MFTEPTVFILGAGASWHYSYPTGENLVKDILKRTDEVILILERIKSNGISGRIQRSKYVQERVLQATHLNNISPPLEKLKAQCTNLVDRLKQVNPPVIDYFLGENDDLKDIGKLMIAWVILEHESKQGTRKNHGGNNNENRHRLLEDDPHPNQKASNLDLKKCKDDWCRFILYRLTLGCNTPSDLSKNEVSFITFNYDVSLERNLNEGMSAVKFFDEDQYSPVKKFLSSERFMHIYGTIRPDPFSEPPSINFNITKDTSREASCLIDVLDASFEASKMIKTIAPHEKNSNENVIEKAKEKIKGAKDIFILGYGFDESNNKLLNLYDNLNINAENPKRIFFTDYEDRQSINKRASRIFFGKPNRFHPGDPFTISGKLSGSQAEKSIRNVYEAIERDFDFSNIEGKA